jgi:hypothetical protein
MMNKFATAALIGGAALACGVLPVTTAAAITAPTPIPVPTSPTAPAMPSTSTPHAPSHRAPSHHRAPTGHRKGKPSTKTGTGSGTGGAGKTGGSKTGSGKTGTGKPVKHKPVAHKPIVRQPVAHRPIIGKPIVSRPVIGSPATGTPKPTNPTRIIGGKPAADAPWAVQINWDDTGFECSGTSVAPQWVLTARHCVNPAGMTVLIGSNKLGDGTKAVVDNKIVDPVGDLALLHLTEAVDTTYVTLADEDPTVGAINEIYGWGKTDPTSGPSDVLKTARVKVTSLDCQDAQQGKAICSTGITGTAYNGDSGGPEMSDGVEVGVCSTGDDETKTQQYASVAANRDWIRQIANV